MYTRKSKNKDQDAKNIFQPFFLTFSPILSIISHFYNKYDGVLKGGGVRFEVTLGKVGSSRKFKNIFLTSDPLGVILCEESIARTPEP